MPAQVVIRWFKSDGGKNKPPISVPGDPSPVTKSVPNPARLLWAELHQRALTWTSGDDTKFLTDFTDRLPCGQCRGDWLKMLKANPPDFANYFAWTVARHNDINRMLKKPEVSLEEALKIWI